MRRSLMLLCVLGLAGCSTITRGTTQAVSIQTPGVDGARCELFSEAIGTQTVVTPATITLEKSQHDVQVVCRKECYSEGRGVITTSMEEMTAGNIVVGGVVGLAVDASSGAMNKYSPNVQIVMVRNPRCKSR